MKKNVKKAVTIPLALAFLLSACGTSGINDNAEITSSESGTAITGMTSSGATEIAPETTPEAKPETTSVPETTSEAKTETTSVPETTSEAKTETSTSEKEETVSESTALASAVETRAPESQKIEVSESAATTAKQKPEIPAKEFYFESETTEGKKLSLSFAASPLENDPTVYGADLTSTNVSVSVEDENGVSRISQTDVLKTPVNEQGSFLYPSGYDIPMKLLSFNDGGQSYLGVIAVPKGDGTYCASFYIYRNPKFTIINGLFPEVSSIDDIALKKNNIVFYDAKEGKNVTYCFDPISSELRKLPDLSNALSLEELPPVNNEKVELTVHITKCPDGMSCNGGSLPPIEYNNEMYYWQFNPGEYIIEKDNNIINISNGSRDWKMNPENKTDAAMMNFSEFEYLGRAVLKDREGNDTSGNNNSKVYMYKNYLIFISNSEYAQRYSAEFRKEFWGFEYFEPADQITPETQSLINALANRGIEYDPSIFLGVTLFEKDTN